MQPVEQSKKNEGLDKRARWLILFCLSVFFLGIGLFQRVYLQGNFQQVVKFKLPPPFIRSASTWLPSYIGYDAVFSWRVNLYEDYDMDVLVLSYTKQKQGKELVYFANRIHPRDYPPTNVSVVRIADSTALHKAIYFDPNARKFFVAYWVYQVGSRYALSREKAKLLSVPAFFAEKKSSELVVFRILCKRRCGEEEDFFLDQAENSIQKYFESIQIVVEPRNDD